MLRRVAVQVVGTAKALQLISGGQCLTMATARLRIPTKLGILEERGCREAATRCSNSICKRAGRYSVGEALT